MNKLLKKITNWEAWPFALLYAPIAPYWAWLMIKSRAVWFFTPCNPKLTFGGMEGEPKREMYDLLPLHLYPTTINILPKLPFDEVKKAVAAANIAYPLIVKPEVGGQGILFRKLDTEAELAQYHSLMQFEYIIQNMVHYPMEVSVFHIRYPHSQKGIVTGFLHKIPLHVIGNGVDTLALLINNHPKAKKFATDMLGKHVNNLAQVVMLGEKYVLSYAANHNRGAQFVDLKSEIDYKLVSVFDKLSLQINDFYYGRYDIMCSSVADLKNGINFAILEYNGCGAEPNHFYDTGYTLLKAYAEILKHWKHMYAISLFNRQQGIQPWSYKAGQIFRQNAVATFKQMRILDAKIP